jgi:hypothetical protein
VGWGGGIGAVLIHIVVVVVIFWVAARGTMTKATINHLPWPQAVCAALHHGERRAQLPSNRSNNFAAQSVRIIGYDNNYCNEGHLHNANHRQRLDAAQNDGNNNDCRQQWRHIDDKNCQLLGGTMLLLASDILNKPSLIEFWSNKLLSLAHPIHQEMSRLWR